MLIFRYKFLVKKVFRYKDGGSISITHLLCKFMVVIKIVIQIVVSNNTTLKQNILIN